MGSTSTKSLTRRDIAMLWGVIALLLLGVAVIIGGVVAVKQHEAEQRELAEIETVQRITKAAEPDHLFGVEDDYESILAFAYEECARRYVSGERGSNLLNAPPWYADEPSTDNPGLTERSLSDRARRRTELVRYVSASTQLCDYWTGK